MIMESGRGKGMHDTQEGAALLPGHSSTFPWLPRQAQEPERFPHLLQPKDLPGEFVPVLVAPRAGGARGAAPAPASGLLDQVTLHHRVTVCLNHSRHTEESFPVPPSASPLVCQHDQHGSTHGAHLAQEGGTGLREAVEQEPSRKEHRDRALSPVWALPCPPHAPCHITSA